MSVKKNISRNGPPIADDSAAERRQLRKADKKFTERLQSALDRGKETSAGITASTPEPKHFAPWKFNRARGEA
jgi:hypothetical protein